MLFWLLLFVTKNRSKHKYHLNQALCQVDRIQRENEG